MTVNNQKGRPNLACPSLYLASELSGLRAGRLAKHAQRVPGRPRLNLAMNIAAVGESYSTPQARATTYAVPPVPMISYDLGRSRGQSGREKRPSQVQWPGNDRKVDAAGLGLLYHMSGTVEVQAPISATASNLLQLHLRELFTAACGSLARVAAAPEIHVQPMTPSPFEVGRNAIDEQQVCQTATASSPPLAVITCSLKT